MSQNDSTARTQRTRIARLRSLVARPALIVLAAGTIAGSAGMAAAAATSPAHRAAPAATMGLRHGTPIHLVGPRPSRNLRGGISYYTAESTNWSGYAATSGTYTKASASWVQPAGTCSSGDQYAAFWVGIDGYSSDTVEQTGSSVDCIGSYAEYYAWYEMYPGPSENYSNTVRAGDHFTATVTYLGGEEFSLYIDDATEGWSHTTDASLGATPSRSSAEVIAEAPCCTASGGILPLTDFGTVNFTGSTANGSALGNAGGVTQIIMVNNAGQEKDTLSSLSSGENFSAAWLRRS